MSRRCPCPVVVTPTPWGVVRTTLEGDGPNVTLVVVFPPGMPAGVVEGLRVAYLGRAKE